MKKMWLVLLMIVACTGLWPARDQVSAATRLNRHDAVTVKSSKTKRYQTPGGRYLGRMGSTKQLYFINRVVTKAKQRYVQLLKPAVYKANYAGNNLKPYHYPRVIGYIRANDLRYQKVILSEKKIKRQAYHIADSSYVFWSAPVGTKVMTKTVGDTNNYLGKTLYATKQMITKRGRYYFMTTAAKKKLGWLYAGALKRGRYEDRLQTEINQSPDKKTIWQNPNVKASKVIALTNHQVVDYVIVRNDDDTATVVNYENGVPQSYFLFSSKFDQKNQQALTDSVRGRNLIHVLYHPTTKSTVIQIRAGKDNHQGQFTCEITIQANGAITHYKLLTSAVA